MPKVALSSDAPWKVYSAAGVEPWPCGEERDISDEQAAYLCGTFPEYFSVVGKRKEASAPAQSAAASAPTTDRAVRSPRKRKPKAGK